MHRLTFALVCCVAFAIPYEAAMSVEGVGTLPRMLGIAAAGAGVASVIASGRLRKPSPVLLILCLLVFWNLVTVFWSLDARNTMTRVQTYAQLLLFVWLIWEFASTPQAQRTLMQAYVLGAYVPICTVLLGIATGATVDRSRHVAFGSDANDLGLTLALAIPMAWHLMETQQRRVARWVNGAYLPGALVAVLLTASRGAFVAAVVACSIVLWTFARVPLRSRVHILLLVAAAAYGAYRVVPSSSWQRLARGREEITSGDLSYRLVIWRTGARAFLEHPVAGTGAGTFRLTVESTLGRAYAAHNSYLGILVDQGLVGFAIFVTLSVVLLKQVRRLPPSERRLCLVLALTWAVGAFALSWEHRKPTWLVFGIVSAHVGAAYATRPAPLPSRLPTRRERGGSGRLQLPGGAHA